MQTLEKKKPKKTDIIYLSVFPLGTQMQKKTLIRTPHLVRNFRLEFVCTE